MKPSEISSGVIICVNASKSIREKYMTPCHSCERIIVRDQGAAPVWDNIYRAKYWDLVHAYNTSWLGWLVLALRRHAEAIADLRPAEALELGALLQRVSQVLQRQTGCSKTYVMQFAESASHPHVHFHIVPRMPEQAPEDISYKVLRHLGVPCEQRPSDSELTDFALAIRGHLAALQEDARQWEYANQDDRTGTCFPKRQ